MSRGLGAKQLFVLRAVDEGRYERCMDRTHRWRWFTLETSGLVTAETPRSELVSLRRAVNSLEGSHLEITDQFPYDFWWFPWEQLWRVGPLYRPGRKLWFRLASENPTDDDAREVERELHEGLVADSIDRIPPDDVLRADFVRWLEEHYDYDLDGFDTPRWWREVGDTENSERAHLLGWAFFGIRSSEG